MTELKDILAELGLSEYLEAFLEQGFDTWATVVDIKESDCEALGVKLGHRRKLQRRIAESRGLSLSRSLETAGSTSARGGYTGDAKARGSGIRDAGGEVVPAKRKYRRHPKPDANAPERRLSAYVLFSNDMRERLKGRQLSFTEIAKLVGEHWQNLMSDEKENYERQAAVLREQYNNELAEYKQTANYAAYNQYLVGFKSRQAARRHSENADAGKRPGPEAMPNASSETGSSSTLGLHGDDTTASRSRADSLASVVSPMQATGEAMSPASSLAEQSEDTLMTDPARSTRSSPGAASPQNTAKQRADLLHASLRASAQDVRREDYFPRAAGMTYDRSVETTNPAEASSGTMRNCPQPNRASDLAPPPLVRDSTTASSSSALSYYGPSTPIEPPVDRQFPILQPFAPNGNAAFEGSLPPLRKSLAPPGASSTSQRLPSPGLAHYNSGFITCSNEPVSKTELRIPQIRSRPSSPSQTSRSGKSADTAANQHDSHSARMRGYMAATTPEDANLDPVSALLKAGQILGSRHAPSQRLPPLLSLPIPPPPHAPK